jgi:hypothetical protein
MEPHEDRNPIHGLFLQGGMNALFGGHGREVAHYIA